jgi:hypothetical protein
LDRANFHNVALFVSRVALDIRADFRGTRHKHDARASAKRLMHALFNLRNRAQFSREADLSNRHRSVRKRAVEKRSSDRERDREICGGLRDFQAAKRLREDILIRKSQAAVLLKHRDQHRKSTRIETGRTTLRASEKTRRNKRVNFSEQTTCSGHRRDERTPRRWRATRQRHTHRFDLSQSIALHLKEADFLR